MISIAHNGQELGQFSADEVAAMLEGGQVDQTAHYWVEGMAEWKPIAELFQTNPAEAKNTTPEPLKVLLDSSADFSTAELSAEQLHDLWKRRSNALVVDALISSAFFTAGLIVEEIVGVALFLSAILYIVVKDGLPNGQSVGKRIFSIKTVKQESGSPCGMWRSIHRNGLFWLAAFGLPFIVSAIIAVFLNVGVASLGLMGGYAVWFWNGERERILRPPFGQMQTDKASKTRVIRADLPI